MFATLKSQCIVRQFANARLTNILGIKSIIHNVVKHTQLGIKPMLF